MKKISLVYCCILIIAAFGIRILFAYLQPAVLVLPDSRGYYALGQIMFEHPSPATIINPYRTPGYPFFLAAVARTVLGNDNSPEAPMSLRLAQAVTTWQTVISVISLVILFLTLVSVFRNPLAAFLFSLFQGLNPLLFIWEHSILTEGLAVSLSTITLCLAFFALRRPAPVRLILLTVFCIIIFLIRPAFMIAPLALFPVIAWFHKKRSIVILTSLICCTVCFSAPAVITKMNEQIHGISTIQTIGPISIFGKILIEEYPLTAASSREPLYSQVLRYRQEKIYPDAFRFFNYIGVDEFNDPEFLMKIQEFNTAVIRSQLPLVFRQMILRIPLLFLKTTDDNTFQSLWGIPALFQMTFVLPLVAQWMTLGYVLWLPLAGYRFLVKKITFTEAAVGMSGIFALTQCGPVLFVVQQDTTIRYLATFFVPLTLFCFYWIARSFLLLGKRISSSR